jgi:hypothetical protein
MTPQLARLTDSAPILRTRCCYCVIPHPTDGLGPIVSGEVVSDGLCPEAFDKLNAAIDLLEAAV